MTRWKRGLTVFAKVFALLFLAGVAIPRVVNVLAGYIAPAGAVAVSRLGVVVNGMLNVLGFHR